MNIAVCVCQVPDTASVIGYVDGAMDCSRVNEVMNPYDEYALEEAVLFRERFQGTFVTVFSVASDSAKEVLRKALAMGADSAVLVSCREEVTDPMQTAQELSRAISGFYSGVLPDLVFCGKQSTDFQSAQVPSMLAEMLGMAFVYGVTSLNCSGDLLRIEREIEGGVEYIDVMCPAVLSAEKGLNTPRHTSIRAVMEARKKPFSILPFSLHEKPFVVMTGIEPVARKKKCCIVPDEKELIRILSQACNVL
ncbi:MAG: electron transfer flavoprotein subunit beta/FixA family protein [Chlorobiaceae bacterium]